MTKTGKRRASYLSPPQIHALDIACVPLNAFGVSYLVGSVMESPDYRDVDVRLMLPDDDPVIALSGDRQKALNYMISRYLMKQSDLNVDFQFQAQTEANKHQGVRNPLGLRWAI